MTTPKAMTAVASLFAGAAIAVLGADVSSQATEPQPQAICKSYKECGTQIAKKWYNALKSSSGPKHYSIA